MADRELSAGIDYAALADEIEECTEPVMLDLLLSKGDRQAVIAALRAPDQRPKVSIEPMHLSDDRMDYFVAIKVGDRVVTPHVFREEYKAAYHIALYDWLLNGVGEEPDCVEFGPDDWPARVMPDVAQSVQVSDLAAMEQFLSGYFRTGEPGEYDAIKAAARDLVAASQPSPAAPVDMALVNELADVAESQFLPTIKAMREALLVARDAIWSGGDTILAITTIDAALAHPGSTARTAPESCPNCINEDDCASVNICRAVEEVNSHNGCSAGNAGEIFERCAKIAEVFGIGRERAAYGGSDIATRIRADATDYLTSHVPQGAAMSEAAVIERCAKIAETAYSLMFPKPANRITAENAGHAVAGALRALSLTSRPSGGQ